NIGNPVEGIHQKAVGAFIERNRHRIDGEIAATQIFLNGCRVNHRLPRLGILGFVRADQVDADGARKTEVKGAGSLILTPNLGSKLFKRLLQLECVSMDSDFDIPDGVSAGQIADSVSREKKDKSGLPSHLAQLLEGVPLVG